MLPEFDLLSPQTLPEALQQLAAAGPAVAPLAGGTNVVPDLRSGRHCPPVLIDVGKLEDLRGIRRSDGAVIAGGCVTISELLASPLIAETAPSLQQAAALFANPLIRNRATLGGNLADASPAADTAPPLLALDAEIDLFSQAGCRSVPIDDFFTGVRKTVRRPDELIGRVRWSVPSARTGFGYVKLGLRKADAISVISVAVRIDAYPDGRARQVRIALGSVAPTPIRAHAAEKWLTGQELTAETIAEAGQMAAAATSPISDLRASADYRRQVASVLVRRMLARAANALTQSAAQSQKAA